MSTALTAQTVAFLLPPGTSISQDIIFADSGVQAAATFSLGQDVLVNFQPFLNFTSGLVSQEAFTLTFLVSAANAINIIAGIPALKTRMASVQPAITDIVTWGTPFVFG
jgi:hypothetical protein